ncbi:hypothetical protein [Saccharopolyspora phatthalungensis]|uniref:Ankyrin repeat protein n=1 Tax=Saccharopolyspora phatthalungensis TaxID=664693 RepID=A0A840QG89_9PSEU|nr:hypothetical protein [Saccharopolyspora phatthalungensis]MBB5159117.1 hypothetical protein [Saccharopolyspora phatthalungensis]
MTDLDRMGRAPLHYAAKDNDVATGIRCWVVRGGWILARRGISRFCLNLWTTLPEAVGVAGRSESDLRREV